MPNPVSCFTDCICKMMLHPSEYGNNDAATDVERLDSTSKKHQTVLITDSTHCQTSAPWTDIVLSRPFLHHILKFIQSTVTIIISQQTAGTVKELSSAGRAPADFSPVTSEYFVFFSHMNMQWALCKRINC